MKKKSDKFEEPTIVSEEELEEKTGILNQLGMTRESLIEQAANGVGIAFYSAFSSSLNSVVGGDVDSSRKLESDFAGTGDYDEFYQLMSDVGKMYFMAAFNAVSSLYVAEATEDEFKDAIENSDLFCSHHSIDESMFMDEDEDFYEPEVKPRM